MRPHLQQDNQLPDLAYRVLRLHIGRRYRSEADMVAIL